MQRETGKYAASLARPVRIELGAADTANSRRELATRPTYFHVMLWSLKMRWWASNITDEQDRIEPDVRIFVRYHTPDAIVVSWRTLLACRKAWSALSMAMPVAAIAARTTSLSRTNFCIRSEQPTNTIAPTASRWLRTASPNRPRATVPAALRRDHGRTHRACRKRCGHPEEPEVRGHRPEDGARDQPDRLTPLFLRCAVSYAQRMAEPSLSAILV